MQYLATGFLAVVGTAIGTVFVGALARFSPWMRRRVETWKRRGETLDEIVHQFRPNNGGSMYDRIMRLERNQVAMAEHLNITIERPPEAT